MSARHICALCGYPRRYHREIDAACPIRGGWSLSLRFTRQAQDLAAYQYDKTEQSVIVK